MLAMVQRESAGAWGRAGPPAARWWRVLQGAWRWWRGCCCTTGGPSCTSLLRRRPPPSLPRQPRQPAAQTLRRFPLPRTPPPTSYVHMLAAGSSLSPADALACRPFNPDTLQRGAVDMRPKQARLLAARSLESHSVMHQRRLIAAMLA